MTTPTLAAALSGVVDLYEEYDRALAARDADPTRATIDAADAAMTAVSDARSYWRLIAVWQAAVAFNEWADDNPEAAAEIRAAEAAARLQPVVDWVAAHPDEAAVIASVVAAQQTTPEEG